jgi:hypothetical protein
MRPMFPFNHGLINILSKLDLRVRFVNLKQMQTIEASV